MEKRKISHRPAHRPDEVGARCDGTVRLAQRALQHAEIVDQLVGAGVMRPPGPAMSMPSVRASVASSLRSTKVRYWR